MSWLACHNPEIDWKTEEVKMTRCLEKYEKQWRPKQRKSEWQKQKEEEAKKKKEKEKKQKKKKMINVKKVVEEWEIWNEEEKVVRSEEEAKKLVPENFHK